MMNILMILILPIHEHIFHDVETDRVIIDFLNCPIVYDDVKVRFLSQHRYVGYFEKVKRLHHWTLPPRKILWPKEIIIHSIHSVGKGDGSDIKIQIATKQQTVFSCSSSKNCKSN
ncbi:phosphatidylinositol 3,4,5-trisphosphate 3-phosphatase TPTE2 isoform X2 [Oryctolagus cuniculus]|uniref:phosphatidylinositol 3,4,5-trisphosphate 3-phosphatase TPTE2 isoform X2 n=1 Tax=Oryctolagus cuniculus TaxID=9986 RepID=UPI00222FD002|nr:phosphatidylinositol 3,4,5-trisphosphate 3-phosphatase TPTE2 isoform X2 [Oryctolagus cuniculus]